jgi:hypothetical protein
LYAHCSKYTHEFEFIVKKTEETSIKISNKNIIYCSKYA